MKNFFINFYVKYKKHKGEYNYWKERKDKENILSNTHFEYYYTTLFDIDKSFYEDKKVLDIGCGPRGSLEWLDNAKERVGLDPLVDKYKNLGIDKHKMKYVNSGSEKISFINDYFDAIFSFNSLDHVDDINKTISEIKRVLKNKGIFLLITEFNHKPSVCEPQSFSEDILNKFGPEFELINNRIFKKEGGIYHSILKKEEYNKSYGDTGIIVAKFIKK